MSQHRIFGIEFIGKRTDSVNTFPGKESTGFELGCNLFGRSFMRGTGLPGSPHGIIPPVSERTIIDSLPFESADARSAFHLFLEEKVILSDESTIRLLKDIIAGVEYAHTLHFERREAAKHLQVGCDALAQFGVENFLINWDEEFVENMPAPNSFVFFQANDTKMEFKSDVLSVSDLIQSKQVFIDKDFHTFNLTRPGYYLEHPNGFRYAIGSGNTTHEVEMTILRAMLKGVVEVLEHTMKEHQRTAVKTKIMRQIRHRSEGTIDLPFPNFYLEP